MCDKSNIRLIISGLVEFFYNYLNIQIEIKKVFILDEHCFVTFNLNDEPSEKCQRCLQLIIEIVSNFKIKKQEYVQNRERGGYLGSLDLIFKKEY